MKIAAWIYRSSDRAKTLDVPPSTPCVPYDGWLHADDLTAGPKQWLDLPIDYDGGVALERLASNDLAYVRSDDPGDVPKSMRWYFAQII